MSECCGARSPNRNGLYMLTGGRRICCLAVVNAPWYSREGLALVLPRPNQPRANPPENRAAATEHRQALRCLPVTTFRLVQAQRFWNANRIRYQRSESRVARNPAGILLLQACEYCSSFTVNSSLGDKGGNPGRSGFGRVGLSGQQMK